MAYNYGYKSLGTSLNGLLNYLQENHLVFYKTVKTYGDLNIHLKEIRLKQEPNKAVSKSLVTNIQYINKNFNFKIVREYFKILCNP